MRHLRPAIVILLVLAGLIPGWHGSVVASLWPALVALTAVITLRNAAIGLLAGGFAGALLAASGNFGAASKSFLADHLLGSLAGTWHVAAIIFTLLLGAFAGVLESGGGFAALVQRLTAKVRHPRRDTNMATVALGLVCFFDGLANSLLLGRLIRPLADRHGISRAKLSYLVDSTSASVACVAFISTWIATQLSLIDTAVEGTRFAGSSYSLFFKSIPGNFYCLFTLLLAALVAWRGWNIGPMKRFERVTLDQSRHHPVELPGDTGEAPLSRALLPLAALVLAIPTIFYLWDTSPVWPVTADKLGKAFSGGAGPYALTLGSAIGLAVAITVVPGHLRSKALDGARRGAGSMLAPLTILVAAWALGGVLENLGTADRISSLLGSSVSPALFPTAVFACAAAVAFLTGTSWGTMGLMMPLAVPIAAATAVGSPALDPLLPLAIAAVFSGAVFGDHCSPFSDTTIVSAIACGIRPLDHVITQLPYALLSSGLAAAAFLSASILRSTLVPLLAGMAILLGLAVLFTRRSGIRPTNPQ